MLAPIALFPDYLCKHMTKCIACSDATVHVPIVFYSFQLILRGFNFSSLSLSLLIFSDFFFLSRSILALPYQWGLQKPFCLSSAVILV